ncbi:class I SAM-dependent methyltransferase [Hamadaea tsunoensis]|uniref:class I SAM-dependent methyltransferase n=1 Tax=Hamadaea tsunoensis TaxID=53368 RepID=UPI00041BA539|nr:class I SAM-dependent methyltransferase [Hamadaea tsunoensis]
MTTASPFPTIDYDANDYDYQDYWNGRDYEMWSEDRVLRRLIPQLRPFSWFADFGGAYGRNSRYYLHEAQQAVILDYSATNLTNAAGRHPGSLDKLGLVRCDLNKVPFADDAFDAAMVIRVLHHLPDVDHALGEMGRTIAGGWLIDVPIKHHLLGLARGAVNRRLADVRNAQPLVTGASDEKYFNFQLTAIRERLTSLGWRTRLGASVNNFRRWESRVPSTVARYARPVVQGLEACTQSVGRGWLGPSQFVVGTRTITPAPRFGEPAPGLPAFTARMVCPACRGALAWTPETAKCGGCAREYHRHGPYWDFVAH